MDARKGAPRDARSHATRGPRSFVSTNFQFQHFATMRLSVPCWLFADAAGLRRHQSFAPARPRSRLAALALSLMWWMDAAGHRSLLPTRAERVRRLLRAAGAAAAAVQWRSPLLLAACALHARGGRCRRYLSLRATRGSFALPCGCCCYAPAVAVATCPRAVRVGVLLCAAGSVAAMPAGSRHRAAACALRVRGGAAAAVRGLMPDAVAASPPTRAQGVLLCAAVAAVAVCQPSPSPPPPFTRCTRARCCCARLAAVRRLSLSLQSPSTRYA